MAETKEMATADSCRKEQKRKLNEDRADAAVKKYKSDQQTGGSVSESAAINIPTSKDTYRPRLKESIQSSDSTPGKESRYSTKEIIHPVGSVDSGYSTSFGKSPGFSNEYLIQQSVGSSGNGTGFLELEACLDISLLMGKPDVTAKSRRTEKKAEILTETHSMYQKQLENFFQRNFKKIKEEVSVSMIPEELYRADVIDLQDIETIKCEPRRMRKVEILIKAIAYSRFSNKYDTLVKVKSVFKKAGYDYIVENMLEETQDEDKNSSVSTTINNRQDIIYRLRSACTYLEDELDPSYIIDDLVVSGTLSILDHQNIREISNRRKKVKVLVENLLRNRENVPTNYASFLKALKERHSWIEEKLKSSTFDLPVRQKTISVNPVEKSPCEQECDCGDRRSPYTEIKIHLPGKKDIEKVVVFSKRSSCNTLSELTLAASGLEVQEIELGSIIITLKSFSKSSHMRFLDACENKTFLQDFLANLLKVDEIEKLSGLRKALCEVRIRKHDDVKCKGKISKKAVVEHFSFLENNLKDVDVFVKEFCLYNASDANEFRKVMDEKSEGKRNQQFLRNILLQPEYPNELDYGLCLFEKLLTSTSQLEILNRLTEKKTAVSKINAEQIKKNYQLLLDELEPRRYIDVLRRVDGHDSVVDAILLNKTRRQRCQLFLDFIVKCDQTIIDAFVDAIGHDGDSYIVDNMKTLVADLPSSEIEDLKEAIVLNYENIVDEIEPREMASFLAESKLLSKNLRRINKMKTRRDRAVSLMKSVLNAKHQNRKRNDERTEVSKRKMKDSNVYVCFLQALHNSGYKDVARSIEKKKDEADICLRHSQEERRKPDCIHIRAEFEIDISSACQDEESDLQIYLHRMIYKSLRPKEIDLKSVPEDKDTYIKNWVINQSTLDENDIFIDIEVDHSDTANGSPCHMVNVPANKPDKGRHTKKIFSEATNVQGPSVTAAQLPVSDPSLGPESQTNYLNNVPCLPDRTLNIQETELLGPSLLFTDCLGDKNSMDFVDILTSDHKITDLRTDLNVLDSDSIPSSVRSLLFEGRCNSFESDWTSQVLVSPPMTFSPMSDEFNTTDHEKEKYAKGTGHILINDPMMADKSLTNVNVIDSESFLPSTKPGRSVRLDSANWGLHSSVPDITRQSLTKSPVEMSLPRVDLKETENLDKRVRNHDVTKLTNDAKESAESFTDEDFLGSGSFDSSENSQFPDSVDGGYYSSESDRKPPSLDTPPLVIFPKDAELDPAEHQNKSKCVYSF